VSQAEEIINNNTLLNTKIWFEKAVKNPTPKNVSTQTGVFFEEIGETLQEMVGLDAMATIRIRNAHAAMRELAAYLKANQNAFSVPNRELFLDGLCDVIVTATGTAHMFGLNIVPAMDEVNRSNFSKFDDQGNPIFNENLKIMKGPNYTPPDLSLFA
jgi:predicted HAD superfamily Cof-like phosphohydrolase